MELNAAEITSGFYRIQWAEMFEGRHILRDWQNHRSVLR